ncbi:MAG: DNA mismatch repair endonuclease MutL [Spirochaetaceae bacterium]|nr:DNA mismatch repair endonuclease MutL [Spirochaetaceae bacterium]
MEENQSSFVPPVQHPKLPRRPVRSLPQEVARKIAAGEVIDRPNAIVRELLDNAVDSGADWIQVEIEGGGIERIRVVDNGIGMTREDLEQCARPHATSKITAETDLMNLSTLGFRGEALSSIAAVSRLQITTATQDEAGNSSSWRLTASVTQEHHIVPANLNQGTIVQSEALFENFPARRTFLKRPAAETTMCRQTFVEKSLPRTDISFRLLVDGKQRLDLPKGQSLAQRFTEALGLKESPQLFYEIHSTPESQELSQQDWKFTIIIGEPSVARNDKKLIYIYVNGRKITEYSLMQAIDYGATGYFPNGTHPVAALFLEVNPALVDFNIHPAKREARFKDIAPIHRGVSQAVRQFFRNYSVSKISAQAVDALFSSDSPDHRASSPASSLVAQTLWTEEQAHAEEQDHTTENIYDQGPLQVSSKKWWQQSREAHSKNSCSTGDFSKNTPSPDVRNTFFNDCYSQDIPTGAGFAATASPNYEAPRKSFSETAFLEEESTRTCSSRTDFFGDSLSNQSLLSQAPAKQNSAGTQPKGFRYLGTTQGVYLVVELGDSLYLIDQHAAHERLLYNQFIAQAGQRQNLLIPYVIETTSTADDEYLRSLQDSLYKAGFEVKECESAGAAPRWEFYSVPVQWKGTEADLERDLLNKRISPEELVASLASTNACRQAVMDGTVLDEDTACQLALDTLALEDPHCPHGRPLWIKISREAMDAGVKRT